MHMYSRYDRNTGSVKEFWKVHSGLKNLKKKNAFYISEKPT